MIECIEETFYVSLGTIGTTPSWNCTQGGGSSNPAGLYPYVVQRLPYYL